MPINLLLWGKHSTISHNYPNPGNQPPNPGGGGALEASISLVFANTSPQLTHFTMSYEIDASKSPPVGENSKISHNHPNPGNQPPNPGGGGDLEPSISLVFANSSSQLTHFTLSLEIDGSKSPHNHPNPGNHPPNPRGGGDLETSISLVFANSSPQLTHFPLSLEIDAYKSPPVGQTFHNFTQLP